MTWACIVLVHTVNKHGKLKHSTPLCKTDISNKALSKTDLKTKYKLAKYSLKHRKHQKDVLYSRYFTMRHQQLAWMSPYEEDSNNDNLHSQISVQKPTPQDSSATFWALASGIHEENQKPWHNTEVTSSFSLSSLSSPIHPQIYQTLPEQFHQFHPGSVRIELIDGGHVAEGSHRTDNQPHLFNSKNLWDVKLQHVLNTIFQSDHRAWTTCAWALHFQFHYSFFKALKWAHSQSRCIGAILQITNYIKENDRPWIQCLLHPLAQSV